MIKSNEHREKDLAMHVRLGASILIALSFWILLWALGVDYGANSAAVSNGIIAILIACLSIALFRAPLEAAPICWVTGALGLWLIIAPFVLGFNSEVLPLGNNLLVGVLTLLISGFIAGEALGLRQGLDARD